MVKVKQKIQKKLKIQWKNNRPKKLNSKENISYCSNKKKEFPQITIDLFKKHRKRKNFFSFNKISQNY